MLALPLTGVATAVDIGDAKEGHFSNKKEVGSRLAGLALNDLYEKKSLCRSPQYAAHKIVGDKIIITLEHADGLRSRTPEIKGFAIRAENGPWLWADDVRLNGSTVEVRAHAIKTPAAVRYGWAINPILSLENKNRLPLRPFRTDREEGALR